MSKHDLLKVGLAINNIALSVSKEDHAKIKPYLDAIEEAALKEWNNWIPVTEKHPENDGLYLVTDHEGIIRVSYYTANFENFYWDDYVVAWMPLPEPYKKEA